MLVSAFQRAKVNPLEADGRGKNELELNKVTNSIFHSLILPIDIKLPKK